MKKLIIVLLALSILFVGPASADLFDDMNANVGSYNADVDKVPSFVKSRIVDETIHVIIEMEDDSTLEVRAETDGDARLVTFERMAEGETIDPTLIVRSDEGTVQSILDSEDQGATFREAFKNGDITFESVSFVDNLLFAIAKLVA